MGQTEPISPPWPVLTTAELFYIKGRIGWRGLKKADFTNAGPFLITGVDFSGRGVDWSKSVHIPWNKYEESPEIIVRENDILITKDGTIGKIALIEHLPGPTSINSHLFLVRNIDSRVFQRFAFYVFQSAFFKSYIGLTQAGSTLKGLSQKVFEKFKFPLPPLPEQHKIAAILSSLDDAIEKAQAVIDQIRVVKRGLTQALLTGGIPGRHTRFKQTEIGAIPEDWRLATLADVAPSDRPSAQTGPFGAQLSASDFVKHGVPVLKIGNVRWGYLDLANLDYVAKQKASELAKYRVRPGDLLFARQGATTGRNALADDRCEGSLISYHIIRVSVDRAKCVPEYLLACFNSHLVQKQVGRDKARGNREGINTANILSFKFPLPTFAEQRDIVAILEAITASVTRNELHLAQLRTVKSGLLSALLKGELRVTPDTEAAA